MSAAWFSAPAGFGKVCFRVGISYISVEQARANLEAETGGLAFGAVKKRSRDIWEKALGRIRVEGGTDRERRIFYTSLYRTYERMVDQSEYGRYYSGSTAVSTKMRGRFTTMTGCGIPTGTSMRWVSCLILRARPTSCSRMPASTSSGGGCPLFPN